MSEPASDGVPERSGVIRAISFLRPHRGRVALLLTTILAFALVSVATPLLTKVVFDRALFPSSGHPHSGLLLVLVAAMVALITASGVLAIFQAYLASVVGQLVMHDLRDRLYRHLQRMSLRFFTDTRTGEIQSRLANDVAGIGDVASRDAPAAVSNGVVLAVSLVAMGLLSWQLTVATLPIVPVLVFVTWRSGLARRRVAAERQATLADMSSIAQETLSVSGALLGKAFDSGSASADRYQAESHRLARLSVRQQMIGRIRIGVVQTFFLLGPVLVYLGAGLTMGQGLASFTPGTIVAFTALQMRIVGPVRDLLDEVMDLQASAALFERVFQYLDLPQEISDHPGARDLSAAAVRGAVSFRDVWFRYPGSVRRAERDWTLAGVSFDIEPGQLAALVGPSGAGKTTATYLVPRFYDVDRGCVSLDGVDVRKIRLSSLADVVGIVTQEAYLLHASVRDNLLFARPDATFEELEASCRAAQIHERVLELEDGYDTVVGERGYRMSGGEKQRLAMARVVLKNPPILVLDEATSSLDAASERLVQEALRPLLVGRTTIAIAHRLSTVLAADVILVLDRGRLVERGTHRELITGGGTYAHLFGAQFADAS